MSLTANNSSALAGESPAWLALVQQQVESLRYGTVEIVVHDSRVTQIEKVERVRLDKPASETGKQTRTRL